MTDLPHGQPADLWDRADGRDGNDHRSHGRVDDTATARGYQLWASQHHKTLIAAGAGLLAAGVAILARH